MLALYTVAASVALFAGALALPAYDKVDMLTRGGESGYVIYPPGGTVVEAIGVGLPATSDDGGGYIHLKYQGIPGMTASINVGLYNPAIDSTLPIAVQIGSPFNGGLIEAYFIPPEAVCGTWGSGSYQLVITEIQYTQLKNTYGFQSAAPYIYIKCVSAPQEYRSLSPRNATLVERAGPSGYVVYPPGGTTFTYVGQGASADDGQGGGYIHVQYQTISDGPIRTIGVDIGLYNPVDYGGLAYLPLAYDVGLPWENGLIDLYFIPPSTDSGFDPTSSNLQFYEYQTTAEGGVIRFLAAAPQIYVVDTT